MKKITFIAGEILFSAVAPAALIFTNFTSWNTKGAVLQIGLSGVVGLFLIFFCLKKLVIDKYILRLRDMATQHLADYKVETDDAKKLMLESAIQNERTIETLLNCIVPMLLFTAFYIVCKALEADFAKLSTTILMIGVSEIIGTIFSILSARVV